MEILSFIKGIISPLGDILDELHTSDEERIKLNNALQKMENDLTSEVIELQSKLIDAQKTVLTAEIQGEGWLQKSWRPIVMLFLTGCIGAQWLGFTPPGLPEAVALQLLDIVQVGLGGYVIGRSAEKIVPKLANSLGKAKQ